MLINNLIFKEKKLSLGNNNTTGKLLVDINKNFIMPENDTIKNNMFNCEINIEVKLQNETKQDVLSAFTSYIIIVELNENENYSKDSGENIYNKLRPVFIRDINDLLREVNMPGLPYNIEC